MRTDETNTDQIQPDKDAFFAPAEEISIINRVIDDLETSCQEFQKVAEGMRPITN